VRQGVARKQRRLEEHERRRPDGTGAAIGRQQRPRNKRFDEEGQSRREERDDDEE
jgi:hypothetical protein